MFLRAWFFFAGSSLLVLLCWPFFARSSRRRLRDAYQCVPHRTTERADRLEQVVVTGSTSGKKQYSSKVSIPSPFTYLMMQMASKAGRGAVYMVRLVFCRWMQICPRGLFESIKHVPNYIAIEGNTKMRTAQSNEMWNGTKIAQAAFK